MSCNCIFSFLNLPEGSLFPQLGKLLKTLLTRVSRLPFPEPLLAGRMKGTPLFFMGFPGYTVFMEDTDWFPVPLNGVFWATLLAALSVWSSNDVAGPHVISIGHRCHSCWSTSEFYVCIFAKCYRQHLHIASSKHHSEAKLMHFSLPMRRRLSTVMK